MTELAPWAIGLLTGLTSARVHPWVNPGWLIAGVAGLLGGRLGALWWGPAFADVLGGHDLPGDMAGATVGGIVFATLAGVGLNAYRRYAATRE